MVFFSNLGVRAKLFLTLGVLAAVLGVVGALGVMNTRTATAGLETLFKDRLEPTNWIGGIDAKQMRVLLWLDIAVMSRESADLLRAKEQVLRYRDEISELWKKFESTTLTEEERRIATEFVERRAKLVSINDQLIRLMEAGEYDAALKLRAADVERALEPTSEALTQLRELQVRVAEQSYSDIAATFRSREAWTWSMIVIGLVFAGALSRLLINSILAALKKAVETAKRIASGEIGHAIHDQRRDELGELLRALKTMDEKLLEIVADVRAGAEAVSSAARQIAAGNDNLSTRTQQQAAALEETASSMEEMTATVRQNADNAQQASQLAVSARAHADQGGAVVSGAVQAMSAINESSRKIADIIGVIDEIAFQTNLLALNAAVEAARAGEQGRGFAVVATEVRNLAQRSATAAKEIKELIKDSVEKVQAGSQLVDQSGKTLAEIVAGVKRVTDIVAEISAASQEQASGIDQVNNAVSQMDDSTQQNAALVEEASAASKAMEQQANALVRHVSFFRTSHQGELSVRAREPEIAHAAQRQSAPRKTPVSTLKSKPRPQLAKSPKLAKASGDDATWQEF